MDMDIKEIDGACHCGAVRLHVRLANGLRSARRCTRSYCRMRGAVAVTARLGDLDVVSGAEALTVYQFNTRTAKHHFCSKCGIHTHHRRRSNPDEYGVNVAILEGLSPFDFAEILVTDGVNHPSDGAPPRTVGKLRFVAAG